ncbi:hypothetical protein C8J56DRAFT_1064296 [Mycena floridula]|nr:hypothetical protein C8J56DRAFT_1064296 [Mycena floridula]
MPPSLQDATPSSLQDLAGEIYGPLLVGVFFSTALYGVNVVQAFTYYGHSSKRDSFWIRGLVLFLFVCVTVNTSLNMVAMYQALIKQFGLIDPVMPLYLRTDPIMTCIVSMPVQVLMAWRIMVITETRVWTCIIMLISMVSFVASIRTTIEVALKPAFSQFAGFRASPVTWLVSSAAADVIITGVLVYSLHTRRSGFDTSLDAYVNRIIRLTIQTGALTAVFALSDALVFVILKVWSFPPSLTLFNRFSIGYYNLLLMGFVFIKTLPHHNSQLIECTGLVEEQTQCTLPICRLGRHPVISNRERNDLQSE